MATEWVVDSKDCLDHTPSVVNYLAATYAGLPSATPASSPWTSAGWHKCLVLAGEEFVRRFLLHVLPKGLMRVRHSGFLANRCRRRRLAQIRRALAVIDKNPVTDAPAHTIPA